jgi:hypothetical protein
MFFSLTRSGDLNTLLLKLGDGKAPDLIPVGDFSGEAGIAINDAIASVKDGVSFRCSVRRISCALRQWKVGTRRDNLLVDKRHAGD